MARLLEWQVYSWTFFRSYSLVCCTPRSNLCEKGKHHHDASHNTCTRQQNLSPEEELTCWNGASITSPWESLGHTQNCSIYVRITVLCARRVRRRWAFEWGRNLLFHSYRDYVMCTSTCDYLVITSESLYLACLLTLPLKSRSIPFRKCVYYV